jgi:site-specific recombinase XerD|tara:strand:- start:1303 stop:2208 length:906 start_codon:yes stop_codon:yes gene_type:complete
MRKAQQQRYDVLYQQHLNALERQGKSPRTIDSYARAVRRITEFFDKCPDRLNEEDLKQYFSSLVRSHSWATVKVDRNGLQFFYKHVLNKQWQWIDIVKPPQTKKLPDILTAKEISTLINGTRELRYQTYLLTVYTMGLRLGEALALEVGDIDADAHRVHIRNAKGRKDRFVILPELALLAMRRYWASHRHQRFIFPAGRDGEERRHATQTMNRGGLQKSFKAIATSCHIHKQLTIHSLRHCYGAHLLEIGLNLRAIQEQMGHDSPKTTALYTQLTETAQQNSKQLVDAMAERLNVTLDGEV